MDSKEVPCYPDTKRGFDMNIKKYDVYKTKKKTVSENSLVASPRDDIFYDFSVFENINCIDESILLSIKKELMFHHTAGACWINQPLPFTVKDGELTSYHCDIKSAFTRVFRSNGNRMMIIVTITAVHIKKWQRESYYDRYYTEKESYDFESEYLTGEYPDIEVA